MMQWVPLGQTVDEFRAAVRTFASVFPDVIVAVGPGGNGYFMLGSDGAAPLWTRGTSGPSCRGPVSSVTFPRRTTRPTDFNGRLGASRSRPLCVSQGRASWRSPAPGHLITDDSPLPEYFLLRQTFGAPSPDLTPQSLGTAPP